ncbi:MULTISPECIES: AraC family transcriptional regulator [Chryseobacterium]|uniref:Helix-turn-helix domain-containing protein n=1 Tax=Chryseobacterium endophyticum TaxID=1854762 RepID=A0AAU6WVU4_9FLAO|nr:helix-turn-helix domain-containing protein [uncultured Chryseobacterium sp.]
MEQLFNIISTDTLGKDMALISDMNGIAISQEAFLVKEYLKTTNSPYFVEEIALILVRNGNARIRINLDEVSISKNTIVILTPNYIVEMLEYNEILEADLLLFKYDVVADLPLTKDLGSIGDIFNKSPSLALNNQDFKEISDLYAVLAYHCNKQKIYKSEVAKNLLYALCYMVVEFYQARISSQTQPVNRPEIIYKNFYSLLCIHYKEERSIKFYADKLNITPKYFSKTIKQISKKNASDLIDEMVIMGAKALLKCTDQSVQQISTEFNFPNPSFFGTFFKRKTGITTLQYRKQHL